MTSTGANTAAIAAALAGAGPPILQINRQSFNQKNNGDGQSSEAQFVDERFPSQNASSMDGVGNDNVLVDDDEQMQDGDHVTGGVTRSRSGKSVAKARSRRASEGAHLSKSEGKRASGELRCEQCGKGYKHSSCLTKHLSVFLVLYLLLVLLVNPFHLHRLCRQIPDSKPRNVLPSMFTSR